MRQVVKLNRAYFQVLNKQHDIRVAAARAGIEFRESHDALDVQLSDFEQQIKDALFIEYCNTPCWRYQC